MSSIDYLLKPTLSASNTVRPIYSVHFMVAFFGGPLSVCLFGFYSISRAGAAKRFAYWYTLLFLLAFLTLIFWIWTGVHGFPFEVSENLSESDIRRWGNRLIGLGLMGMIYLFQQPLFAISKMDTNQPNALKQGILFVLLGMVLTFVLIFVGAYVIG